jgi:hypothetical protein
MWLQTPLGRQPEIPITNFGLPGILMPDGFLVGLAGRPSTVYEHFTFINKFMEQQFGQPYPMQAAALLSAKEKGRVGFDNIDNVDHFNWRHCRGEFEDRVHTLATNSSTLRKQLWMELFDEHPGLNAVSLIVPYYDKNLPVVIARQEVVYAKELSANGFAYKVDNDKLQRNPQEWGFEVYHQPASIAALNNIPKPH